MRSSAAGRIIEKKRTPDKFFGVLFFDRNFWTRDFWGSRLKPIDAVCYAIINSMEAGLTNPQGR